MKKCFLVLTAIIMCVLTVCASGAAAEDKVYYRWGGVEYYLQDGKAVISKYHVSNAAYESAYGLDFSGGTVQGYEIIGIDSSAFTVTGMLESIKLPNSLEFIGDNAFRNCDYLMSLNIPDSVTHIGNSAFSGCTNLGNIKLSAEIESIGSNAFYNTAYYNDTDNWKDNILYLDKVAINVSDDISDVEILQGTELISNEIFRNNTSLKTVKLPDTLKIIGEYAFSGCKEVCDINMPESLIRVGNYAFYNCSALQKVSFASGIRSVGNYSFFGCKNLTVISFDDSPVSIGNSAFYNCANADISLGNNVVSIGNEAFASCYGITGFFVPASVESIGKSVFKWCKNLESITVDADNHNYLSKDGVLYNKDKTEILCYPPAKQNSSYVMPENVKKVAPDCFFRTISLKEIVLSDTMEVIEKNAFESSAIEKLVIGRGVKSIGNEAFKNCASLNEIIWNAESVENFEDKNYIFSNCGTRGDGIEISFGSEVKHIPSYLFYGDYAFGNYVLPKIISVEFGNGIETIGAYSFYKCSLPETLTIGENVKTIGSYAFSEWAGLKRINWNSVKSDDFSSNNYIFRGSGTAKDTEIVFGENVETVPAYIFDKCDFVKYIKFSDSIKAINEYAFYNCSSVEELSLGKNIETIADYAFYGCSAVEKVVWNAKNAQVGSQTLYGLGKDGEGISVEFGEDVEKIPANMFSGSKKLKYVEMASNITSIGDAAFSGCSGLTELILSDNLVELGRSAFYGCTSLKGFQLPAKIAAIGPYAFANCSSLEEVTTPKELKELNSNLFNGCTSLIKIKLLGAEKIGESAFNGCSSLTEIEITSELDRIDADAFKNTAVSKKIYISDLPGYLTAERVNEYSNPLRYGGNLYVNGEIVTDIRVPEGVTELYSYYLYGCSELKTVYLPESLKIIGNNAFANCKSLEFINFPENLEMICECAFLGCTKMSDIDLPDNLSFIGSAAFYDTCYYQNDANWENGLLYNGDYLLGSMSGITKCYIKENTRIIAENVFMSGCMLPEEVYITDLAKWCNITFCSVFSNPCTAMAADLYIDGEKTEVLTIPEGVKDIKPHAFSNVEGFSVIVIPENVITIGEDAFGACSSILEVHLPNSIEKISKGAFLKSKNISRIYYHGNESDWSKIRIETNNDPLLAAEKVCYNYVILKNTDGTEIKRISKNENDVVKPAEIPQKEEHTFEVYRDVECANKYDFSAPVTADTDLFVKYISNQYSYKFLDENGGVLKEETVDYGSVIIPPHAPTKENTHQYTYVFAGWKDYTEGMTQENREMVFTATYTQTLTQYTYKFLDEDGSVLKEETAGYAAAIIPPEITDKSEYYLFNGWENYTEGMLLTDDVVFTAVYKYKDYYIAAEGLTELTKVAYNSLYNLKPQSKDGYSFIGYFTEKDGKGDKITNEKGESLSVYNIAGNLKVYPCFSSNYMNKIELKGTTSAMPGDTITQKLIFATDKDAMYFVATVKYPKYLSLKNVKGVDFKEATKDSEKEKGDYKYADITCLFDYEGNFAKINTNYIPFEIEFDIAEDIPEDKLNTDYEISAENVMLIGDDTFTVADITNHTLTILPKLAESIEIIGENEIDAAKKFSAIVSPEYTTDKSVVWSVNDESVATIVQDGTLTPLKNGTVTITATANDGSKVFATKTVNVIAYAKINSLDFGSGVVLSEFNPDVRKYTVYVKEDVSTITLTPKFSGGVLRANANGVWISGRPKEFELNDTVTTIALNRENVTDMTNSVYTIEVVKLEGTKTEISEDKKIFTVTPINIEKGKNVILALYDGDKFIEMQSAIYKGDDITYTTTKSYTVVKVMVWDFLTNIMPACDVEELN